MTFSIAEQFSCRPFDCRFPHKPRRIYAKHDIGHVEMISEAAAKLALDSHAGFAMAASNTMQYADYYS